MPPRFAYWTIILDNVPTSFRTKDREEILPLFNQLKAKNPGALLKWFSGGRLWDSPEQARDVRDVEKVRRFRDERAKETKEQRELEEREMRAFREKHGRAGDDGPSTLRQAQGHPEQGRGATRHGDERSLRTSGEGPPRDEQDQPREERKPRFSPRPERRGRDWRPGGDHSDPRDKYKLPPGEARKRWKERNLGPRGPKPFGSKPGGDRPFGSKPGGDRPYGDRPRGPKPFGSKPGGDRPFGSKPGGDRPYGDRPRGPKPFGSKPGGEPSTSLRPGRPYGAKPGGGRSFGNRPGGPPSTRDGGKRPLRPGRPFGGKPKGPGGPRRKG
jgi:23S rRNA pseudouridine2605 synthase